MTRFRLGLVVGKFAPLHLGHVALIDQARRVCERVAVVSYSRPEYAGCEPERRARWLADLFPEAIRLVLSSRDGEFPPNDADDTTHRRFVAQLSSERLGALPDAIFTSEAYGDGFAHELTRLRRVIDPSAPEVIHVLVDLHRSRHAISSRLIRGHLHEYREWLPAVVYADFVERIAILGGESSGKSSLAASLASRFDTVRVAEYGRERWEEKQGQLVFDDLLSIAREQVAREEEACRRARRFLFCDTSPLTTLFYSHHLFGRAEAELEELAARPYRLVVLCAPDFPFVQDGTREGAALRDAQHAWYLRELAARGIDALPVAGSIEERVATVDRWIDAQPTVVLGESAS